MAYSMEMHVRACELIERGYGKCALASELAVPVHTAQNWIHTYKAAGKEVFLQMGSRHRRYDYETKLGAAADFVDKGMTRQEVMEKYGMASMAALKRWVASYREGGAEALKPKPKGRPPGAAAKARELTREQELERRIQRLEAENAYLKKSIALKVEKRSRTARGPRP